MWFGWRIIHLLRWFWLGWWLCLLSLTHTFSCQSLNQLCFLIFFFFLLLVLLLDYFLELFAFSFFQWVRKILMEVFLLFEMVYFSKFVKFIGWSYKAILTTWVQKGVFFSLKALSKILWITIGCWCSDYWILTCLLEIASCIISIKMSWWVLWGWLVQNLIFIELGQVVCSKGMQMLGTASFKTASQVVRARVFDVLVHLLVVILIISLYFLNFKL